MVHMSIVVGGFLLLAVFAQPATLSEKCATSIFTMGDDLLREENNAVVSLSWTRPAKFPNAEETFYESNPYSLRCPTFVAESNTRTFSITGINQSIEKLMGRFTAPFRVDESGKSTFGEVFIFFDGGYLYPGLRRDCYLYRIFLKIRDGKIVLDWDFPSWSSEETNPFKNAVIGYRVNGGPLRPAYFEGRVYPVNHSGKDKVEIFAKGEHVNIKKLIFDFANNRLIYERQAEFPK